MAKGIENRARSPPAVFDFATSQIQKHGGTKMYYDLVESGKRIKALRKEHGLTQEQLAEQLGVAANSIARIETGNRGISIDLAIELVVRFDTSRIDNYLGKVTPREMVAIEKALSVSLAMEQLKKRSPKHKAKRAKE